MGPKKGKKGKGNKDDDWGDESEKLIEEKMKNLMSTNDAAPSEDDLPATKTKPNKNKKKGKVKGKQCIMYVSILLYSGFCNSNLRQLICTFMIYSRGG